MKFATWNVNSIGVRLEHVLTWMKTSGVDVLALQETKCVDERFPHQAFSDMGYEVVFAGQPKYNGVALISRLGIDDLELHAPWDPSQKRMMAATIQGVRVINVYVPNGQAVESDKYPYKLSWLASLAKYVTQALAQEHSVLVMGDFNIAPYDEDTFDPQVWGDGILVSPAEREAFQGLLGLGLHDLIHEHHPEGHCFTWWDYRRLSFRRKQGLRIDHMLASKGLADRCKVADVDREPRGWERPSDHAVVWADFAT